MANHVIGTSKRMVVSQGGGATKDMGAAASVARRYAHLSPSSGGSSTARQGETAKTASKDTGSISSHNDINQFTSGISEHHPYKPRGGAFDTRKDSVMGDTTTTFRTASGGGTGKTASKKMSQVLGPDNYNNTMKENHQPGDVGSKGNPSGPKGGIRAVMNRMKK